MRPVSQRGFTLTEALIALAVLGLLVGLGIPKMSDWVSASKAGAATQFYADGFSFAHNQALTHNAESRLVLSANTANGQYDWQVDICFPTPATPCNDVSGSWSTTTTAAANDPDTGTAFKSVKRPASALPKTTVMTTTLTPSGATAVYFTPLGWVDTNVTPSLQRIALAPVTANAFPQSAVVVTLAGAVSRCNPAFTAPDSRGCPP